MYDVPVMVNSGVDLVTANITPDGLYYVKAGVIRFGYGFSLRPWLDNSLTVPYINANTGYSYQWQIPISSPVLIPPAALPVLAFITFVGGSQKKIWVRDDRFYYFNDQIQSLDLYIPIKGNAAAWYTANNKAVFGQFMLTVIENPNERIDIRSARTFKRNLKLWNFQGALPGAATCYLYCVNNIANYGWPTAPVPVDNTNFFGGNDDQPSPSSLVQTFFTAGPVFMFELYEHIRISLTAPAGGAQDIWLYSSAKMDNDQIGGNNKSEVLRFQELIPAALWQVDVNSDLANLVIDRDVSFANEWFFLASTDPNNLVTVQQAWVTFAD